MFVFCGRFMIRKVSKSGCVSVVMCEGGDICNYLGPLKGPSLSHRKLSDQTEINPSPLTRYDRN